MIARPIARGISRAIGTQLAGGSIAYPSTPFTQLITVACGNSISAQSKEGAAGVGANRWGWFGELMVSNLFNDAPMRFKLITPSTRTDKYGTYGYSGQTLDTINSDIATEWIAPINAAGVVPELVIGLALLENDIASGASVATMQTRLNTWISTVQAAWPSAKILLCTPRPSFSYNTGAMVTAYQLMRSYTLGKATYPSILVANLSDYEDPANPGKPLPGYTDVSVHPTQRGAMVNARRIAASLRTLGRAQKAYSTTAANQFLTGSSAASGTNVTGTVPTSCSLFGSVNGVFVSTAQNPGWAIQSNTPTPGNFLDLATYVCPQRTVSSPPLVSPYIKVRVASGAENLAIVQLDGRFQDGSGNNFRPMFAAVTADPPPDFFNGDVLTFVNPPQTPASGTMTAVQCYIRPFMRNTTGASTIEVIEQAVMLPT